jgi:hypothetical protein
VHVEAARRHPRAAGDLLEGGGVEPALLEDLERRRLKGVSLAPAALLLRRGRQVLLGEEVGTRRRL